MDGTESPAPPADLPGLLPQLTADTAPWLQPNADLDLVIFSKDRASQLDGLLRSIRTFLGLPHRIHVLYTTSSDEFEHGYDCLRRWHAGIDWIDQGTTFQRHVVALVERIAAGPGRFLMFLVDDMLFTRPFTAAPLLADLANDDTILAVSLRLGENIDFCYTRNSRTRPPDFTRGHRWAWKTASPGYWDYPMSTDGNIYRARDLVEYLRRFRFKNPNTMEANMARDPLPHPDLVCEATPCVINLAVNLVQSTFPNRHGNVSAASLNGAFLAGFALDVRPFVAKRFSSCHIEAEMPLVPDPRPRASRVAPLQSGTRRRIDLREIPCFVINLEEHVEKRRAMEEQLCALGMRYEIVPGIKADPGWIGVALAHLKVLRLSRAEIPFLVLEDDCEFNRHFEPVIEVPAEAAALYLGVSRYGLGEPGQRGWGVADGTQWERYDEVHLRVHNMLARHAVLYLSSDFQHKVIEAQVEALTNRSFAHPGDIGLAMQQATHLVLTPNHPVCMQRERPETGRSLREIPSHQRPAGARHGAASAAAPDGKRPGVLVLISHRYRFLYVHLPKNASTTLKQELRRLDPQAELRHERDIAAEHWRDYVVFAFLRDPVARLLSAYSEISDRIAAGSGPSPAPAFAAREEGPARLAAFLDWIEAGPRPADRHVLPQSTLLGSRRLDFLGRVETLDRDLRRLYEKLATGPRPRPPAFRARNRERAEGTAAWLTPALRQRVLAIYRDDVDLLDRVRREETPDDEGGAIAPFESASGDAPAVVGYRTLTEIADCFGTDKGTTRGCAHHYTRVYDVLFAPLRLQPIALLEIGLAIGGPEHGVFDRRPTTAPSVSTWLEYFPQGRIYGFDYSDFSHLVSARFDFVRGDCGVEADLERLTRGVPALDVIVDDGSHSSYHQQLAFRHLFPKLKPGGLYIIEDLFWQNPAYEQELPGVERSRIVFHRILASAAPFGNAVFAPDQVEGYRRDIASFEFFGWLGGPVRPPGDLRNGDLDAAKLLVMRRRD